MKVLFQNGLVFYRGSLQPLDLAIAGPSIAAVGRPIADFVADRVIDVQGAMILPGFIDMHTHLEDTVSGYLLADSYRSGTEAALRNGITTVFNFVTQGKGQTLEEAMEVAHGKAKGNCFCHYGFHLTPTRFSPEDWDSILQKAREGYRTFKFYTTYKQAGLYCSYAELEAILRRLAAVEACCLIHCEDEEILSSCAVENLDQSNALSHARLRPPQAEIEAVRRMIAIAEKFPVSLHIVHVSTMEAAQQVYQASQHMAVTCETAPQYLFLNEEQLAQPHGYRWICSPPLRPEENRRRMKEAARTGWFHALATDHCPFRKTDKDQGALDFAKTPNGVAGVGALAHLAALMFDFPHSDSIQPMVAALSENPARITGLFPRKGALAVGSDADLLILRNSRLNGVPVQSTFADAYETYPGFFKVLDFQSIWLAGQEAIHDHQLLDQFQPSGKAVVG